MGKSSAISNFLKHAHNLQDQITHLQKDVAAQVVSHESEGARVEVSGKQELVGLSLPENWQDLDKEKLERLLMDSINGGLKKSQALVQQRWSRLSGKGESQQRDNC